MKNIQLRFEGDGWGEIRVDGQKLADFTPMWDEMPDDECEQEEWIQPELDFDMEGM